MDASAWELQGAWANYIDADPPVTNCTYFDYEVLYYEFMPRYVTTDIICDVRDMTAITTEKCKELYDGGIFCNNYNLLVSSENDCSEAELLSAWTRIDYANELLMLRDPEEDLWWYFEEDRFQDGFDWVTAVDEHSKRYWLFEFDDYAWAYHGEDDRDQMDLLFICLDEANCQTTNPVEDLYEETWLLSPFIPHNVTVPYLPLVECMEEWIEGYPYVAQSAICGLEDGIREVHMCRDPVQCSRIPPDYHNTMLQHHVWHLNTKVRGILVDTPEVETWECYNFKDWHSYIWDDNYYYDQGDEMCDEGRLWTCVD